MNTTKRLLQIGLFLILLLEVNPAQAQSPGAGRFGAGVIIGAPTALTGKYWAASDEAVDFGFSFWGYRWSMFYGDYHWYWRAPFGHRSKFASQLSVYVGVGGGVSFWNERRDCGKWSCNTTAESGTAVFARIPGGIEWYPARPPLGVFVEIVPSITIVPGMSGFFDAGVGVRYYF